ncbi:MAG: protein phosphatase [Pseudomonadota bacterium]
MNSYPQKSQPDAATVKLLKAEAEAARAPLHRVAEGIAAADIFVGTRHAASDPQLLAKHGIVSVLNCAVNLDINNVETLAADIGARQSYGWAPVRYYKLGMIDGPGNPREMVLAGYLQMRAILGQEMPDKPSYPWPNVGNILVNCRGGRSRSVIVVSVFLHAERRTDFPTLASAIDHVRKARELDPMEWPTAPKQVLIDAADWALEMIDRMELKPLT